MADETRWETTPGSAILAAARAYLRLVSQLAFIHGRPACGTDIMTPERIEAWAIELGWKPESGDGHG